MYTFFVASSAIDCLEKFGSKSDPLLMDHFNFGAESPLAHAFESEAEPA